MVAHCLFEQSGTFKDEFKKLGVEAIDYDCLNDYNQTDVVIDLFHEINMAYDGKKSIFDNISQDDIIMAFFPCTRFESQGTMLFRGEAKQFKKWTPLQILEYNMSLHDELHRNYIVFCKMVHVVLERGLKIVIENPQTQPHYLTNYFCFKPSIIDYNRRDNGDYYEKPTQYWFFGFEPKQNIIFEPITYVEERKIHLQKKGKTRSEIHPQYASRFIRQFVLDTDIPTRK